MDKADQADKIFAAYGKYYDLLYQDKAYSDEVDYVDRTLRSFSRPIRSLLEFGSGTGKHGSLLAAKGYLVHGIERSAEMAERSPIFEGFTFEVGDIRFTEVGRRFDAVISLFHVISYQTGNQDLHAVFANAARHLAKDGLFLFDFWYSPALAAQPPLLKVKRMADDVMRITRLCEPRNRPNENRVDVRYTIFAEDLATGEITVLEEEHPMRYFSLPEIDLLAEIHGFRRVAAEEFLTGRPASEQTFGLCVVLEKR